MTQYVIVDHPDKNTIITDHPAYNRQIWTICDITYKRSKSACAICGCKVGNRGYRPLTNLANRSARLCPDH